MSEEMEVACLLCLSDDKLSAEMFWVVCQMTNRPQRRFEPFVRWQIVPRDVLSHLSDDKLPAETFWAICQMTNCPQRRFWDERSLHFKKNDDFRVSLFWSFCLKGYFYGLPRFACNDGYEVTGLPRFARNDGCEVTGLPRWRLQWRAWYMSLQKFFFQNFLWRQFVKSFFPCSRIKDCICGAKRYG